MFRLLYRAPGYLFFVVCVFVFSAAVVAIMKLPVATSSAVAVGAGLAAVAHLANENADNTAKLGSAGGCEGWWIGSLVGLLMAGWQDYWVRNG